MIYGNKFININEKVLIDEKDIYYNKDKFESRETNLCVIVGLSGRGKTTTANDMQNKAEVYQLDDLCGNYNFSDPNLKEYGDLFYSYFKGEGKQFRVSEKDPVIQTGAYYYKLIKSFCEYTIRYAKTHKNKRIIIEEIEPLGIIEPNKFDDFAVYIKGTSQIKSILRSSYRDSSDTKGIKRAKSFITTIINKLGSYKEQYKENDKFLNQ